MYNVAETMNLRKFLKVFVNKNLRPSTLGKIKNNLSKSHCMNTIIKAFTYKAPFKSIIS